MTGEKNKYVTQEKLWKIEDGELSTPEHNELILQLLDKKNIYTLYKLIKRNFFKVYDVHGFYSSNNEIVHYNDKICSSYDENDIKTIDAIFEFKAYKLISEYPIKNNYNNFVIGYADIYLSFNDELPLKNIIEYGDCGTCIYAKKYILNIIIEVKPKIKSFGETLRQLNTYKEFSNDSLILIYSPDDRFKEAFESQGIQLITPLDIGIN